MQINLIAAMDCNNGIGSGGNMPWELNPDLKRFRELTMGKPVVMGRVTADAIGKPLYGRLNVILSAKGLGLAGFTIDAVSKRSIEDAINHILHYTDYNQIFIIGGAQIYQKALDMGIVDRMYLTLIDHAFECDTFFPEYDMSQWKEVSRESHSYNDLNYSYVELTRIDSPNI